MPNGIWLKWTFNRQKSVVTQNILLPSIIIVHLSAEPFRVAWAEDSGGWLERANNHSRLRGLEQIYIGSRDPQPQRRLEPGAANIKEDELAGLQQVQHKLSTKVLSLFVVSFLQVTCTPSVNDRTSVQLLSVGFIGSRNTIRYYLVIVDRILPNPEIPPQKSLKRL